MEGREGEKPKEQPIVEGNVLLLAWAGRSPAEPCWPVIQTAAPQEPWHSVSLPTKQTQSETASIFLKSQLDLPPGGGVLWVCVPVTLEPSISCQQSGEGETHMVGGGTLPACYPAWNARSPGKEPRSYWPRTDVNSEGHALGLIHVYVGGTSSGAIRWGTHVCRLAVIEMYR